MIDITVLNLVSVLILLREISEVCLLGPEKIFKVVSGNSDILSEMFYGLKRVTTKMALFKRSETKNIQAVNFKDSLYDTAAWTVLLCQYSCTYSQLRRADARRKKYIQGTNTDWRF